ncbi:MAG TPA: aspartyl protease family protein [Thermoanaerobaculia bacterium]|nr:aspartyl protease family protein [Thermoanaerobaculia bacterium]
MRAILLLLLVGLAGCALYSDVSIAPLAILPTRIDRGTDIHGMLRKADYLRALEMAPVIEGRARQSAADLIALARAEVAAARYDAARRHIRAALALKPPPNLYAEAAWLLSQADSMTHNFATALEWAETASQHGLQVVQWHMDYLRALREVPVHQFTGASRDVLGLAIGRPDVPRIEVRINDAAQPVTAILDSGAALSIISERLERTISPRRLDVATGTFYGLLGEPIAVRFAILDAVHLGLVTVRNVPVAVMPDEKMRFFITGNREFAMDFLLGANLLKEFRIEIDFARARLTLTRLTSLDRRPAEDQNLFFENFRPVVRGTIQKRGWYMFVLDTGSEVTYLNESQLAAMPIDFFAPRIHTATLQGLGGARKSGAKIEDVEIGVDKWAGTFRTLPMYSGGENERAVGIIGENFLKNFHVVIDFGRMRLDLERR